MRETCVFYASWFDAIETMPEAAQSEAYRAVLTYALRGEETAKQGPMTKLIMAMVRPVIDTNNKRYENGCKGGRPKTEKPNHNQNETKTKPNHNQNETTSQVWLGDNVNVNDNVNDNVISLSFEERERIFEIFYFERNLATAKEECEKFINHYEANGWCRGNSDKPIKNKVALAKSWKVEREEKRLPDNINRWLHGVYNKLKDEGKDAWRIFTIEGVVIEQGVVVIKCPRQVAELIESVAVSIPRDFDKLAYRVKREG